MRWLSVAVLCGILGAWALGNYFDERDYNVICREARRERLRKMNIGGQIVSESELER